MRAVKSNVEAWTLPLGKVDYNGTGRRVNAVELEVRLRRSTCGTTVDLKPCADYTELSVCGAVWNARRTDILTGGQNVEEVARLAPSATARRLAALWKRWHLNGMRAGCAHQIAEKWAERPLDPSKPTDAYVQHPDGHHGWNMLVWVPRDKHPEGLLGHPCAVCGYKYGTKWLAEPLPPEVDREVRDICGAFPGATRKNGE